ncbi:XrtA system polysaccharide chain length determinant [Desulfonatronum lacustre]|uniref:XrtA system polysaccharide chain length determinant n=1 Tax=Desulfonatronum lacustre TaxID=66849 RepID=UPI0004B3F8BB|nr:XrtA system polysaccharide chain length determinant [Desulfonatronum lacustre]
MSVFQSDHDIKKYLQLAYRRRFLIIFVTIFITFLAILFSLAKTNQYQASSTVFIEESVMASLMKGIAVTPSMDAKIRVLTTAMESRTMILNVLRELNMDLQVSNDANLEALINDVRKSMGIRLRARDGLFVVSFTHKEPREARDFVNTIVRRYIEENLTSSRQDTYDAFRFLAEQGEVHRKRLEAADAAVLEFRIQKGDLLNRDPGQLLQEIAMAEDRLQELTLRRFELLSRASSEEALAFDGQGNPVHGRLNRLDALERRLGDLLLRYGPAYPEVVQVKSEIQLLEQIIKDTPDNVAVSQPRARGTSVFSIQAQELRTQEERLRRLITYNTELLQQIPLAQAEFAELEHKRSEEQRVLEQLMNRYGQAEVSRQMELQDKTTSYRIVDPAILPTQPVSPNRLLLTFLGLFGGLGAGIGLTLGLDVLDRSVRHVDKLKGLGVPVLAVVPEMPDPVRARRQRTRNLALYFLAGLLMSVIAGVVLLELLNINILYNSMQSLMQRPEVEQALGYLKRIYWQIF